MTANGTNIFILRGQTLYSYTANNLHLVAQADLPAPKGMPVGFPGGGPGAQQGNPAPGDTP